MDRRGESEESGDDDTRRRSINGDVDPNQPTNTSKSSLLKCSLIERDMSQVQSLVMRFHRQELKGTSSNSSVKMAELHD